jgi:hypothetical protein
VSAFFWVNVWCSVMNNKVTGPLGSEELRVNRNTFLAMMRTLHCVISLCEQFSRPYFFHRVRSFLDREFPDR